MSESLEPVLTSIFASLSALKSRFAPPFPVKVIFNVSPEGTRSSGEAREIVELNFNSSKPVTTDQ